MPLSRRTPPCRTHPLRPVCCLLALPSLLPSAAPPCQADCLQDFWQEGAWQFEGASAFFNKDWSMNPHGKEYERLVLNEWWTRTECKTDARGAYAARGFHGDYEVTVTAPDGRTKTVRAKLPEQGAAVTVAL